MASIGNVFVHPAARARLERRLAEIDAQLAMTRGGALQLLRQPDYLAKTRSNAARERITVQEMHRRGIENMRDKLVSEMKDIQCVLAMER